MSASFCALHHLKACCAAAVEQAPAVLNRWLARSLNLSSQLVPMSRLTTETGGASVDVFAARTRRKSACRPPLLQPAALHHGSRSPGDSILEAAQAGSDDGRQVLSSRQQASPLLTADAPDLRSHPPTLCFVLLPLLTERQSAIRRLRCWSLAASADRRSRQAGYVWPCGWLGGHRGISPAPAAKATFHTTPVL